jgi:hypothetical protein
MAAEIQTRTVRPKDAVKLIERCIEVGRPVMLWGGPGIGKSDIMQQIGDKHGRPIIDVRLLLCEPTDLKGIPYYDPAKKTMCWARPNELPGDVLESPHLQNAILFLDEMNSAPPSVQAAAYQLMLNKRIGEYHLPEGVSIVCAGNRDTDRGVTYRMPSPLANRIVHLELAVNFDDWQAWALTANVHPDVVGFLSQHKSKLCSFDPKSPDKAFATPRSWAFVSQLLDDDLPDSMNTTLVAGTVGEGIAIEFAQHRKVAAKMPKVEDILNGKNPELKVTEISAMYSLTISMCYTLRDWVSRINEEGGKFKEENWHAAVDNFLGYMLDNFGPEMCILGAKSALRDFNLPIDHRKLKLFHKFQEKYGKHIIAD